jgi:quercetin dioxygenase-like cupin family protein
MDAKIIRADEAGKRTITEPWGTLAWIAGRTAGNSDRITVGRVLIKRGMNNPRHRHPKSEEVLHLLRGRLRHTFGGREEILEPGDTIVIPAGEFHNAFSIGGEDAEMIVSYPTGDRDFEPESGGARPA